MIEDSLLAHIYAPLIFTRSSLHYLQAQTVFNFPFEIPMFISTPTLQTLTFIPLTTPSTNRLITRKIINSVMYVY